MTQGKDSLYIEIYIEKYIYININTVLKMDNVYWYYRLEWCFLFSFLIKKKKKTMKKIRTQEKYQIGMVLTPENFGSIQELLPRGLVP